MDVTKKELIDFLNMFGDPSDYKKLDDVTHRSIKKLREMCDRFWFYSKSDDYIISNDTKNSIYKFKEVMSEKETMRKYMISVGGSDPPKYLDLYHILKRDKLLDQCISK
jgi:hypothetical protein